MANIQITNITPAVSTPAQTDVLPCEQSLVTKRITSQQIAEANMSSNAEALTGTSTSKHTSPANLQYVLDSKNGYYASPSAVDQGVDNNDLSIKDLINTIGSAERAIILRSGTYTISTSLTIPSNITLKVLSGAVLTKGGSATLTINGKLEAGHYQIFSGYSSGLTIAGANEGINVKWFGATGDGSTDDITFITAAIASIGVGLIFFPYGTYNVSTTVNIGAKDIFLEGFGDTCKIINTSVTGGHAITFGAMGQTLRRGIRNMQIKGNALSGHGIYFNNAPSVHIENCDIGEHGGWGLYFDAASHYNHIDNSTIRNNTSGGAYFGVANENQFTRCDFIDNTGIAIHISANAWGIKVIGGSIEDNDNAAIKIVGSSANVIEGVWFEDNNTAAGTEMIYIEDSHSTTFLGNWISIRQDIYVKNSQGITFINNNIGDEGIGAVKNLVFESDCEANFVEGNEFGAGSSVVDKSYKALLRNNVRRNNTKPLGFHKPLSTAAYNTTNETNLQIHSTFHATSQMTALGTSPPTITYLTNDGWYDDRSNKVTFPAGVVGGLTTTRVACTNGFTLTANKIYIISAMMKASTAAYFYMSTQGGSEALSGINFWVDTTWRRYIFASPLSTQTGSTGVNWWPVNAPGADIDLYIDDVMVLEITDEGDVPTAIDRAIYIPTHTATKQILNSFLAPTRFVNNDFHSFVVGDTTPSVKKGNLFTTANTAPTTITTFDDGVSGQEIIIIFTDANTTIAETGNIKLSAAFTSTADDTMRLIFDETNWYELSRSIN